MTINPFFNAQYYLANNNDLLRAGLNSPEQLWQHYMAYGAQESRMPNPWFNGNYYLQFYPDLTQNGITAVTALDHYYQYGINEQREMSPALSATDFRAADYAARHTDVAQALGIQNPAVLSPHDKANLLKHFLTYGYQEGREEGGVWGFSVRAGLSFGIDGLDVGQRFLGSVSDDTFVVFGRIKGASLDGLGGNDTLELNISTDTGTHLNKDAVQLRNIENIVVKEVNTVEINTNIIPRMVVMSSSWVDLHIAPIAVAGANDTLYLVNQSTLDLTVNGVETIYLSATADSTCSSTLFANQVNAEVLRVHVDSPVGGAKQLVEVGSYHSPALQTVVIDGSAAQSALVLSVDAASLAMVKNTVMMGGAADDYFLASAAINTLTGGGGANTFDFTVINTHITDGHITGLNTITDFGPTDQLELHGRPPLTKVQFGTGDLPAGISLEQVLSHHQVIDNSYLHWHNDTYVIVESAAVVGVVDSGMEVIKLIGEIEL